MFALLGLKICFLLSLISVLDTGCLFTCGDGSFGQLGHGDCNSHCSPLKVSYFDSKHVDKIACGMRHSLVLMKGKYLTRVTFKYCWLHCS